MSPFYVETLPALMVSAKVMRWIDSAGDAALDAFDAARTFAEGLLPAAVVRFDSFEPLVVVHCASVLVIMFDKTSERFCIVAFYTADGDPTPPDGPTHSPRPLPVTRDLLASLGLYADEITPPLPDDDRLPLAPNDVATMAMLRLDSGELRLGRLGQDPAVSLFIVERDLPRSRSTCFATTFVVRPYAGRRMPQTNLHNLPLHGRANRGKPGDCLPA